MATVDAARPPPPVPLVLLLSGISQPVKAKTRSYTATFTDISGLHEGADVRVRGVLAGRVTRDKAGTPTGRKRGGGGIHARQEVRRGFRYPNLPSSIRP